ncbi:MAG: glycosyltransferase family 4 protein [Candidatus Bathyarchaeia archaeon]
MYKPIKVLLLSFVPLELEGAGTARLLIRLADFLSKKTNIELEICTLGPANKKAFFNGCRYTTFRGFKLRFLQDISPSKIRYVLGRRGDHLRVLIVGTCLTDILIALSLRLFSPGTRIVQIPQIQRDFVFRNKIAKFLYKLRKWVFVYFINFKIVQPTLIVYSREEEDMVRPFVRNIIRRPLGIELKYVDRHGDKKSNVDICGKKLTLLHVGDIHRNKFPLFALEVMKKLKEVTGGKVKLIAVGRIHSGHYKKLREKMREYGVENTIRFTGLVSGDELLKYWESADVFVLFSASEGSPHVVFEAMLHRVPVVATRVGIVPELEARGTLLAAEYGDVDGMTKHILKLRKDKKLIASLVQKAMRDLPNYDVKYFLETVYHTLL